ncbi:class I SAM-dependent methyltransferase [Aestuariispira insulae]|uniref:Methyltransferase family protein n=1 Tax=Aestuariispira insulae TaxID=1461337 RepID=A0A3D9H6E0_9PROT|nr:class I SAM-dependent methyltransferase [Aestuariispira insulae]RED45068.1 methyltransferase family protein [Aestuariispira insulae]
MTITDAQIEAGQAVYSSRTLKIYDILVLGLSNRFIWQCSTSTILAFYNQFYSTNHLDVGVGTGWFPAHAKLPGSEPVVTLLDLNQGCLDFAAQRIAEANPSINLQKIKADVFKSLPNDGPFQSICLGYLLHCLPGSLPDKAIVLDNVMSLLAEEGTLFGATILSGGVKRGWAARRLMAFYNSKGIFTNDRDSLSDLKKLLEERFSHVDIRIEGCVALFQASGQRRETA